MRLVSVAPRSAPWIAPSISRSRRGSSGTRLRRSSRLPSIDHQQIVEVVRDAAGQLAEALHLLHLVHLRQRRLALARALLDAALQFGVGLRQLGGALGDAPLQLGVQQLELAGLAIQLGEHPHLGAQHLRHHRHRHVIDRAELVAAQPIEIGHRGSPRRR